MIIISIELFTRKEKKTKKKQLNKCQLHVLY